MTDDASRGEVGFAHRLLILQDAGAAAKAAVLGQTAGGTYNQIVNGKFKDDRWSNGTWVLSKFAGKDGETNWDKVTRVLSHCQMFGIL